MDRGEESFSWSSFNFRSDHGENSDEDDRDDSYFELELRPRPHNNIDIDIGIGIGIGIGININIIDDEELEFVDVPFPGFHPSSNPPSSYEYDHHQNLHADSSASTQINSRWGPWGLVQTTRKVASSAKRMNRSRMVKVRVINIITISAASMMRPLERWFANFMRLRFRSTKNNKSKSCCTPTPLLIHQSAAAAPTPREVLRLGGGGDHTSLLHAAIAHCNHSYFPPLNNHAS